MDDALRWRTLPVLFLVVSFFVLLYIRKSNAHCRLLPYDHYVISSRLIITPQGIIARSIDVKGGNILSVAQGEYQGGLAHVEYGDAVIMPGLVDVHAHLDEPGQVGTKAAATGGVTTLIDVPLNSFPSTVSVEALKLKVDAAKKKIYVDIGFWGGLVPENAFNISSLESLLSAGALGLKEGLYALAKYKRPLLVHSEVVLDSESMSDLDNGDFNPRAYATYLKTRPSSW